MRRGKVLHRLQARRGAWEQVWWRVWGWGAGDKSTTRQVQGSKEVTHNTAGS